MLRLGANGDIFVSNEGRRDYVGERLVLPDLEESFVCHLFLIKGEYQMNLSS